MSLKRRLPDIAQANNDEQTGAQDSDAGQGLHLRLPRSAPVYANAGPSKGGLAEGRARRILSVIQNQKTRVVVASAGTSDKFFTLMGGSARLLLLFA